MSKERDFYRMETAAARNPFLHNPSDPYFEVPLTTRIMASQLSAQNELKELSEPQRKKSRKLGLLFETVTVVVLGVLLALGLHIFVTQVYAISGQSMEPTLHNGERVVIHKLSPSLVSIERGDMIIFSAPRNAHKNLIKRVIGLPGDQIEIDRGQVFVNGMPLDEDYARVELGRYATQVPITEVEGDHVYVLGDNRPASQDSRHFGLVPIESIRGKVFLRVWPLDTISTFP